MENQEFLRKLKTGDKVIIRSGWRGDRITVGEVEKVTSSGQIMIKGGARFTKQGNRIGESRVNGSYLRPYEEDKIKEALELEERRKLIRKISANDSTWHLYTTALLRLVVYLIEKPPEAGILENPSDMFPKFPVESFILFPVYGLKTQVAYIPTHAEGNLAHPDVQYGFIASARRPDGSYKVRYWSKRDPNELRTKANSEITDEENLVAHATHTKDMVDWAWDEFVAPYLSPEEKDLK